MVVCKSVPEMEELTGAQQGGSIVASGDISATALVDAMPTPALLLRLDDTIVGCNPAAAALFMLPRQQAGGNLRNLTSGRVAELLSALEEIKDRLSPNDAGQTGLRVDLVWGVVALRPVLSTRGAVLGILVTGAETGGVVSGGDDQIRNIDAADESSGSEGLLPRELDQPASLMKNEFLAMLAHELRNPLAAILHALHVLRIRVTTDHTAIQALRIADRQARHQARLLDDLLDASRVVLGKFDLRFEDVDLGSVLSQTVADTDHLFRSRAQDVALELPPDRVAVRGDPQRLEQVFKNLLINAAKYTGPGGRVQIGVERDDQDVVVRVRDTGIGIEADMLPRIFNLFFQIDSSLARSEGGLGIGLTLVQYIVRLHGGSVLARSEGHGRGSEFEVRLPLAARAARDAEPVPTPGPARPRRVLLIEDNRDARQMLRMLLELVGHRVEAAGDGESGIRLAVAGAPEIVLVDIGLPDLNGYAVAERLRKLLGGALRLVAVSGYGDAEMRQRATAAGFDRYLVKPVTLEELCRTLDSL